MVECWHLPGYVVFITVYLSTNYSISALATVHTVEQLLIKIARSSTFSLSSSSSLLDWDDPTLQYMLLADLQCWSL